MKYFLLILSLSLGMASATAIADLRVLVRFDESGHRLHQVLELAEKPEMDQLLDSRSSQRKSVGTSLQRSSTIEKSRSLLFLNRKLTGRSAASRAQVASAILSWYDWQGELLAVSQVPDPRVVHLANPALGIVASYHSLSKGAWLARGPADSAQLVVSLPDVESLQLGQEQWTIALTGN